MDGQDKGKTETQETVGARIWSNKQATGRNNDHWAVHHLWVCRGISTFLVVTMHQDKANVMY